MEENTNSSSLHHIQKLSTGLVLLQFRTSLELLLWKICESEWKSFLNLHVVLLTFLHRKARNRKSTSKDWENLTQ
jgi:hypothetical protein